MRNMRSRRAFTLIELIIVIVILGILAAIAIVGYQAVINRANESKVEQAALSYDRSLRALVAFDQNQGASPQTAQYHLDMIGDHPDGVNLTFLSDLGADDAFGGTAAAADTVADITDDEDPTHVVFDDGTTFVVLALSGSPSDPGTIHSKGSMTP